MRGLLLLTLLLGPWSPAWAQEPRPTPEPGAAATIDATKLGVSLARIQKGLKTSEQKERQAGDGLRLEFQVQVYGEAPRIQVLEGVDLVNGAVPGTAPTHRQLVEFLTPQIYRTPGLPLSALAGWAANQLWQKSKKTRCEEEIAAYRAMLMQGISVSAPRCAQ
jgi:hypothetical protein